MERFMNEKVIMPNGDENSTKDALKDAEFVCFYFSAHWCPPCKQFTPKLREFYTSVKIQHGVEIVFVSSDRTASDMNNYYTEAHGKWLRVAHKSALADHLKAEFEIQGIPTLVVCKKSDHSMITEDGVKQVCEFSTEAVDKWINGFDWENQSKNEEIMNNSEFLNPQSEAIAGKDLLQSKELICFYFSAHWCPPCRGFTPKLKEFYNAAGVSDKIEIIFISGDRNEEEMNDYYKEAHGSWLRAKHRSDTAKNLMKHFNCEHFPFFVVIKNDGTFITKDATRDLFNFKGNGMEIVDKWSKVSQA